MISNAARGRQSTLLLVARAASIGRRFKAFSSLSPPLFLVVHNIDGPALQDFTVQRALAELLVQSRGRCQRRDDYDVSCAMIRLVASVDNVDASGLLWDTATLDKFAWIWKQTTTYDPYNDEILYGSFETPPTTSRMTQTVIHTEESILNVLNSIASRHSEVLKELATMQLQQSTTNNDAGGLPSDGGFGVVYRKLLKSCEKKMFVTSDTNLRIMMRELTDHNIVQAMKRDDGTEIVFVADPAQILKQIEKLKVSS
mmetsp:Transcript_47803/g.57868  ORF Transcript_47803/g.57868 Transcript_47803/m.57868 type:complete len:256 (+) Transcript_47803:3-770(+)